MITALPYLLLVTFFGVMAFYQYSKNDQSASLYIGWGCAFILLLFFGLRGFIFYDWMSYYPLYTSALDLNTLLTTPITHWPTEPGFTILVVLCNHISHSWHFFTFVCTLINVCLLCNFLRRYIENIPYALVLFLCFGGFEICTDLMRNSISILIFANSLIFIEQRRFAPYLFLCLLGAMFHASALFYIPFYWILNIKFNKWLLITIFVIVNIIYLFHIPIFKSIVSLIAGIIMPSTQLWIDVYMGYDSGGSSLSIGYLERLLSGILLFCYIDKLRKQREDGNIFINSIAIYLFLYLLLSEFKTISQRVSMLFIYGYWIFWYDLFKCIYLRNNRILFGIFVSFYCLLKTYGTCSNPLADYDNVMFGIKSYTERVVWFGRHFNDTQKKK